MNAGEFNTELGKLLDRAMTEGVAQRKLAPADIVGIMEIQKLEIVRHFQDLARAAAAKANPVLYLPKR